MMECAACGDMAHEDWNVGAVVYGVHAHEVTGAHLCSRCGCTENAQEQSALIAKIALRRQRPPMAVEPPVMRVTEVDHERGVVSFVDSDAWYRTDPKVTENGLRGLRWDESKWTKWVIDAAHARLAEANEQGCYSLTVRLPTYREDMVNTIIAEQVTRGGVDTEGTRAQAERWCAMLAGCICDGMRATTSAGAYRLTKKDGTMAYPCSGGKRLVLSHGPLGRP